MVESGEYVVIVLFLKRNTKMISFNVFNVHKRHKAGRQADRKRERNDIRQTKQNE